MHQDDPLDAVLLGFSEADAFTIRDSFEGVQIFGGIGSGKTSGSGALFARSFLSSGYGGLVLTAKVEETDRLDDLIVIGIGAAHRFNFLDYEQKLPDADAGLTENIVRLFETIAESTQGQHASGGQNEQFWMNEFRKLLRNTIDLLRFARLPLSLKAIHDIVFSAPTSLEEANSNEWQDNSVCHQTIIRTCELEEADEFTAGERHDLDLTINYWTHEYPTKPDKTRATVLSIFSGTTDVFLRGFLHDIFGTTTTVTPEALLDGKIIILDFPQKRFNDLGVIAQILFKFLWQRVMERRQITPESRPVFLWIDESQFFVNKHDVSFQTTARSARVATVLLSQNLPNYYAALGGESASKSLVDSLLGNLTTKIFHNNTCATTNRYAADLFAQDWQNIPSSSLSHSDQKASYSHSQSSQLQYTVLPREFTGLIKGGPKNNFLVEGIVHKGGEIFDLTGTNALKTVFLQT
jgi:hypothetical protein